MRRIIFFLFLLIAIVILAQSNIKPVVKCKVCNKPLSICPVNGKHISTKTQKSTSSKKYKQNQTKNMHIIQQAIGDMVYIEGGSITLGYGTAQKEIHVLNFHISKYEVTQELWLSVMGRNPSKFNVNLKHPVEQVSWNDCQIFINKLNRLTGMKFRLPTEAEWQFAALGGRKSEGNKYAGSNDINEVAWYNSNSVTTNRIGTKKSNELGLFDMNGNVWEWCSDSTGSKYNGKDDDYIICGGGWNADSLRCKLPSRTHGSSSWNWDCVGLRLAL